MRKPWEYEDPLCAQIGDSYFFLNDKDEYDPTAEISYEPARKVCRRCEHITECAEWALKNEDFGFWGGLSPAQRRTMRSRGLTLTPKRTA